LRRIRAPVAAPGLVPLGWEITWTEEVTVPLFMAVVVKLVFAGFLRKAIGATIAIFVVVGFVLGFLLARLIYHRRR
jgi:hypothetical protein